MPNLEGILFDEVEKHNTEEDCWMILNDLVLKLPRDFLDEHPGGPEIVLALAGKDATSDFEDVAHSDSARAWANKLVIGYKQGAETSESDPIETRLLRGGSPRPKADNSTSNVFGILLALFFAIAGVAYALVNR
eukprot:TRINITY_DN64317_c0_g1_i1.p1 TRINITY_DN64317_c0_g1~~TRINITY_DN64317_c0_g1_i1.p1  ORF type:complete len:134 (-),score=26.92 TRINITY_DN64317_c0_g1_i1:278-679(-)